MLKVVVASANPAKVEAVQFAFEAAFGAGQYKVEGVEVSSGVAKQPLGDKETRTGARQRVLAARNVRSDADFWVGIEAGVDNDMTFSWITIENANCRGESRSASITLPLAVQAFIRQGNTLGEAMQRMSTAIDLTDKVNLNQPGGAISYLTQNLLCRSTVYQQAILLALAPFRHELYQKKPV